MKALILTLGHNSSALFFDGVNKPIGYEQERLDGIKGSSAFPFNAIEKIIEEVGADLKGASLLVSHWFDSFDETNFKEKYWNAQYVQDLIADFDLDFYPLMPTFTHHDAHAYSSRAFFLDSIIQERGREFDPNSKFHFVVADGFGNRQEVLSIYETTFKEMIIGKPLTRIHRSYGYNNSLGLLYQYATSFCGMKENQDEYKFLGYESHIGEVCTQEQIEILKKSASETSKTWMDNIDRHEQKDVDLAYINVSELTSTKYLMHTAFTNVLNAVNAGGDHYEVRVIIGFYIQAVVENIMTSLVHHFNMENVVLSGGCFYNVKLNKAIYDEVPGYVCVMPLAGDQGAGIGMYDYLYGKKTMFRFGDLCWGKRNLQPVEVPNDDHIIITNDRDQFVHHVVGLLNEDKIVNVMSGEMEFGPRALCNTSTLAKPTRENVNYINMLNDRNTVMPMAPVIRALNANAMFSGELVRVIGSNRYMIITHDYIPEMVEYDRYRGVMHQYPLEYRFSGRPQIIDVYDKRPIAKIVEHVKYLALINTSFNRHGTPILYSAGDGIRDFVEQRKLDDENRTYLVVYYEN